MEVVHDLSTDESLEDISVSRFTRRRDAKMQRSQDSGAVTDCSSSDSGNHSPVLSGGKYVTVLSVNGGLNAMVNKDHVTVVSIRPDDHQVDDDEEEEEHQLTTDAPSGICLSLNCGFVEEVANVRRAKPGHKLGFGLKFDLAGQIGQQRLFIQCCAKDTPASTVRCSWGKLVEADEIVQIDGLDVAQLSRLDVVRQLTEGSNDEILRLKIRHYWDDQQRVAIIQQLNATPTPVPTYSKPQERAVDVPEEFLLSRGGQKTPIDDTPPVPPRRRRRSTVAASGNKEKATRSLSSDEVLVNGQRVSATPSKPPRSGRLQASRSFGPSTPTPKTTLPDSWNDSCTSLPCDIKDPEEDEIVIPTDVTTTTTTTTTVCEMLLLEPPATFLDADFSSTEMMEPSMPDTLSDSGASSGSGSGNSSSELLLNLLVATSSSSADSCASTLDGSDTEAEQLIAFQQVEMALESGMFDDVQKTLLPALPAQEIQTVEENTKNNSPASATQRPKQQLKAPSVSATLRSAQQQRAASITKREIATTKIPTRSKIPQAVGLSANIQPTRTTKTTAAASTTTTTTKTSAATAVTTTGPARPAGNNRTRPGIVQLPASSRPVASTKSSGNSSSSSSVKSGLTGGQQQQQLSRIPRFNSTNNINKASSSSSNNIHQQQVKSYNKLKGESTTNVGAGGGSKGRSSSNNNSSLPAVLAAH